MTDSANESHGITYVSRNGERKWHLDLFLAMHPRPGDLPRPERDVLASLLRFCLDGLAHLDAVEASSIEGTQ